MSITPDPDLTRRLADAAEGLTYASESDRSFTPFFLPAERLAGAAWPLSPERFAATIAVDPREPAEEADLDEFLARHIGRVDPADEQAVELRPRYERLAAMLREALADLRVIRVGSVEVRCYLVGRDPDGNVAGLETVAVET